MPFETLKDTFQDRIKSHKSNVTINMQRINDAEESNPIRQFKQVCFELRLKNRDGVNVTDVEWEAEGARLLKNLGLMVVKHAGGVV